MSRRAAFLLPDMGGGGAERLTLDLMAGFLARGAEVDLVLMARDGAFLPLVPGGARVVDLATPRLRHVPRALRGYLKAEQPGALLAAMWPLTTAALIGTLGMAPRPRLVVADHSALLAQFVEKRATSAALRASVGASYRFADGVVAVSEALAGEVATIAGLPRERVTTIPNPIPVPLCSAGTVDWGATGGARVLAAGSFKAQKNFPLLLRAFASLAQQLPATLTIIGEGPDRAALEAQIAQLDLSGRVLLPGFTSTPGDWYASADLFVLSSNYEGFGNVLVEAMHCGLPVVATDCPHGPAEVLGHGRWGTLVPPGDPTALAVAMHEALAAPVDAAAQCARAAEFSVERAVEAYWSLMFGE